MDDAAGGGDGGSRASHTEAAPKMRMQLGAKAKVTTPGTLKGGLAGKLAKKDGAKKDWV